MQDGDKIFLTLGIVLGITAIFIVAIMLPPTKADSPIIIINNRANSTSTCQYNIMQLVNGSNPRTIQEFGCPNGNLLFQSTNASAVFNDVMTRINSAGGGVVHVTGYNSTHPYNVTSAIIIPNNGHLYFYGDGSEYTILQIPSGSDNNLFQFSGTKTKNSFFNSWRDFEGMGNQGSGGVNNRGFVFNGTSFGITDSIIYNVFLRNFKQDDIYFNGVNCWNNKIDSDTIELAGRAGLYLTGTTSCLDVRVLNTKFLYNSQYGIYSDVTESTYVENWFYKNQQVGAKLNGESRSIWEGNRFMDNSNGTNNGFYDMWILGSANSIVGNHFYGSENGVNFVKYGVFFDTFENTNTFTGNTFGTGNFGTAKLFTSSTSQSMNLIANNAGYNPVNKVTNPFWTTGNTIIPNSGNSALPNNNTDTTNTNIPAFITVSGGTGVSITLKDNAGNTIQSGLATITEQFVPYGYKINIKWSTSPNVTVWLQ